MAETAVAKKEESAVQKEADTRAETVYVPDIDIIEDKDSVHLVADMPGVDRDSIEITVENNVLTIEGKGLVDTPEGYDLVGQEFGIGRYRRDLTFSEDVDPDGIKARVRHGVLNVTLPKREQVKTRKIKIES